MSVPIRVLMEEHQMILRALDALETLVKKAEEGEVPRELWQELCEFFREFADKTHHGKEEDLLFTRMVEEGFPSEGGPIHCMLEEHRVGRSHIRAILEGLERKQGEELQNTLIQHGRGFCELLRDHIYKEDHILFPMAQEHLDDRALQELQNQFRELEAREGKRHSLYWQRLKAILEALGLSMVDKGQCSTLEQEYGLERG